MIRIVHQCLRNKGENLIIFAGEKFTVKLLRNQKTQEINKVQNDQ